VFDYILLIFYNSIQHNTTQHNTTQHGWLTWKLRTSSKLSDVQHITRILRFV